jgi:hypothetical protein
VRKLLGAPSKSDTTSGEDDGGVYHVDVLIYQGLQVDIDTRSYGVERLLVTSGRWQMPSGVRVGSSWQEVRVLLQAPDTALLPTASRWEPRSCSREPGGELNGVDIEFSGVRSPLESPADSLPSRIVMSITLTRYGP